MLQLLMVVYPVWLDAVMSTAHPIVIISHMSYLQTMRKPQLQFFPIFPHAVFQEPVQHDCAVFIVGFGVEICIIGMLQWLNVWGSFMGTNTSYFSTRHSWEQLGTLTKCLDCVQLSSSDHNRLRCMYVSIPSYFSKVQPVLIVRTYINLRPQYSTILFLISNYLVKDFSAFYFHVVCSRSFSYKLEKFCAIEQSLMWACCLARLVVYHTVHLLWTIIFFCLVLISLLWVCVFGGSRIGGSHATQDELYFKHQGKRLNCSYTKNKLQMSCTLSVGRKTEEISIDAQRNQSTYD